MTLLQSSFPSALAEFLHLPSGELARAAVRVGAIWLLAWFGMMVIRLVARRIVAAVDEGDPGALTLREKQGQTISQLLRSVGRVLVFLVAALLTLDVFFDIGPLLAGAGILGLAVSFGAQSLVKDVISGFFILLENQFAVGDVIEAAGKSGAVEQMSLRVVKLRDVRGVLHIIPNGQIGVVSNATRGWGREVVDVSVSYEVDVDQALGVFRDEAARFGADPEWAPRMDGAPDVLGVESLTDSAVIIRTLLRARPGDQWALGREFRRRILRRLEAEGMEIPFPQRTVHVRHHSTGGTPEVIG
jgi:small conductance mechanosensitive channel